jgi:zinc/manganese transport system ATP-binding protein
MIELQNVNIFRSQRCLINNCQLQLEKGGFYALTGDNGSGKSTLLKTIIGELSPTSGRIVRHFKQGEYSYLPQKSQLNTDFPMSVQQAVMTGLWLKFGGFIKIEPEHFVEVDKTLEEVGLLHLKGASINQLSGGELQRVLFARMLIQKASLLLLDEPLAAIDQSTQNILLSILKAKHEQGTTIVITLHDVELVKQYATQQLHIREQKVHLCRAQHSHSDLCCHLPLIRAAS